MGEDVVVAVPLPERQAIRHVVERIRLLRGRLHDVRRARREIDELRVRIPDRIDARIAVERDTPVRRVAVGGERYLQDGLARTGDVAEARGRTVEEARPGGLAVHEYPRSARRLPEAHLDGHIRHRRQDGESRNKN